MASEKKFTNMELTLQQLSAQLLVTPHQLSELVNESLKMNFRAFINGYRIREAERLLIEQPESSVLEIAFTVGFNSKTSFNVLFYRYTGSTPSEYRKNRLPAARQN